METEMQDGKAAGHAAMTHTARTRSIYMQHGYAACNAGPCTMGMKHWLVARTCSMDKSMQHGHKHAA
jgi:hypothetical protein